MGCERGGLVEAPRVTAPRHGGVVAVVGGAAGGRWGAGVWVACRCVDGAAAVGGSAWGRGGVRSRGRAGGRGGGAGARRRGFWGGWGGGGPRDGFRRRRRAA